MSGYQGDIQLADTIFWTFTTVSTTGAPTVLTGSPTATAYTDGGITQSATGVTLTADFDGVVGLNLITVVATGANGFATGETIDIVLDAGTVGGTTVIGYSVGTFSIERNPVNWNRVAGASTTVDLSATTTSIVDTATAVTTVNGLAANVITAAATNADHIDLIWDELLAGHTTADTTGLLLNEWQDAGRLDLILDIIAADVVNLDGMASLAATDIVSAGAITTLTGAIVNVDLVDLCTTTTTNTDVTALNDVAATDIVSSGAITTSGGAVTTVTTATNVTTVNGLAANVLTAAATAADHIDLIWDELLAGHVTADTTGLLLNEWQDGGRLDLILDIIAVDTTTDIPALIATAQADLDIITGAAGALLDTTATSAQLVDDVWDEVLTGGTHAVADSSGRRLRDLQEFGTYEDGAIWIDTVNGAAGTTDFESGTYINPVDNINDANTLATSVGLSRFKMAPNSSITLVASQDNQEFDGTNWTLALGGSICQRFSLWGSNCYGYWNGCYYDSFRSL